MTPLQTTSAKPKSLLNSSFLADFLKEEKIAGAVTLVAHEGTIVHCSTTGYADLKTQRFMKDDDLFWIASMTKPITAAAVMMLVDESKLTLDDPVEKWLPEFENPWVIVEKTTSRVVLERAARVITLRDLLRHTHGLQEEPQPNPEVSLSDWGRFIARGPLEFEPGQRWQYGNVGMNVLGRVVEVASNQSFPIFLKRRFFDPLGMNETTFFPTASQKKRLVTLYVTSLTNGPLEEGGIPLISGEITSPRRTVLPGSGLFSTAHEMLLFFQMIADGGVSDGRRYLSKTAVKEMTTSQTADLQAGFGEGMTYGLGFNVLREPGDELHGISVGSYGHDGVAGTAAWIEPHRKLVLILMMQGGNLHRQNINYRIRDAFHTAACTALDAPLLK